MDVPVEVPGQAGKSTIVVASGMLWGRDAGPWVVHGGGAVFVH